MGSRSELKYPNFSHAWIYPVLARIFHELLSRDHEDGRACHRRECSGEADGPPGNRMVSVFAPKLYVAGATLEDARKDGRIHGRSK